MLPTSFMAVQLELASRTATAMAEAAKCARLREDLAAHQVQAQHFESSQAELLSAKELSHAQSLQAQVMLTPATPCSCTAHAHAH